MTTLEILAWSRQSCCRFVPEPSSAARMPTYFHVLATTLPEKFLLSSVAFLLCRELVLSSAPCRANPTPIPSCRTSHYWESTLAANSDQALRIRPLILQTSRRSRYLSYSRCLRFSGPSSRIPLVFLQKTLLWSSLWPISCLS